MLPYFVAEHTIKKKKNKSRLFGWLKHCLNHTLEGGMLHAEALDLEALTQVFQDVLLKSQADWRTAGDCVFEHGVLIVSLLGQSWLDRNTVIL